MRAVVEVNFLRGPQPYWSVDLKLPEGEVFRVKIPRKRAIRMVRMGARPTKSARAELDYLYEMGVLKE